METVIREGVSIVAGLLRVVRLSVDVAGENLKKEEEEQGQLA